MAVKHEALKDSPAFFFRTRIKRWQERNDIELHINHMYENKKQFKRLLWVFSIQEIIKEPQPDSGVKLTIKTARRGLNDTELHIELLIIFITPEGYIDFITY
jgi:hypothetical protein